MATNDSEEEATGYKGVSGGARVLWIAEDADEAAELLGGGEGGDD